MFLCLLAGCCHRDRHAKALPTPQPTISSSLLGTQAYYLDPPADFSDLLAASNSVIEIHPHALHAAFAAEAAAAQGKFWEMHDAIFHYQHTLEDADLAQFAETVGLDLEQYTRDMTEQRGLARIKEDVEGGERSGVQGTPTFFINGILYRGSWEHDALLAALQAARRTA